MATPTVTPVPARTYTTSRVMLVVAVVLLIALNLSYWLFLRPKGQSLQRVSLIENIDVLRAVPLPNQRIAILTNDNRLVLAENGKIISQKPLSVVVFKLEALPGQSTLYGGSNERQILSWEAGDGQLIDTGSFNVNGRVTGLGVLPDGRIAASYSIGQFTGKSWVALFDSKGKAVFKNQTGIDATALAVDAEHIYVTDVQGSLSALSVTGKTLWQKKLAQPATELQLTSKNQILTGDERGGVALFNADGSAVWSKVLSEYKIRMAHDDPASGLILVGDSDGSLFALKSETGEPIFKTALNDGAARSYLSASDSALTMITERGAVMDVNLTAALGAQRQGLIDTGYWSASAALAFLALIGLVLSVPRLRQPAFVVAHRIKQSRTAYILILPSMLLIAVFSYYPTITGLYYSFTNFNLTEPIKFIGLDNFRKLTTDRFFWVGVGNMVLLMITGILKALIPALIAAELVFWLSSSKVKYVMRTAFIIPSIVPGVVSVLLWKQIYQPNYGLLNEALKVIGLPQLQHAWLGDEATALWAIIFAGFPWVGTFGFLILFGGLLNINRELFDASAIDGANAWQRFIQVDLPLLRPQLRLLFFFAFLGAAQEYGGIWIFTRGGPGVATYVPALQMFLSISAGEFGYAAAIGLALAAAILVVTVARFRFNQTPENA